MIDIENKVFNDIADAVRSKFITQYPKLTVVGEYIDVPPSFPCITIVEDDNYAYTKSQDDVGIEHHVNVMYSVNIYTNNVNGKKALAKSIADVVDGKMKDLKFTRRMRNQIPNQDRSIYRITMRYSAIVGDARTDKDGNLTYQIYTK